MYQLPRDWPSHVRSLLFDSLDYSLLSTGLLMDTAATAHLPGEDWQAILPAATPHPCSLPFGPLVGGFLASRVTKALQSDKLLEDSLNWLFRYLCLCSVMVTGLWIRH